MNDYSMGFDAGLDCAIGLLRCGALRKDVTLLEVADHLAMMKIEREPVPPLSPEEMTGITDLMRGESPSTGDGPKTEGTR